MQFYYKDNRSEERWHIIRPHTNHEDVSEKNEYHIDVKIFSSMLSHLNFILFSYQANITLSLLGIRCSFLGILICLLVSLEWYLLYSQSTDLVNFQP